MCWNERWSRNLSGPVRLRALGPFALTMVDSVVVVFVVVVVVVVASFGRACGSAIESDSLNVVS